MTREHNGYLYTRLDGQRSHAYPSPERMARDLGIGRSQVYSLLREAEGFIERVANPDRSARSKDIRLRLPGSAGKVARGSASQEQREQWDGGYVERLPLRHRDIGSREHAWYVEERLWVRQLWERWIRRRAVEEAPHQPVARDGAHARSTKRCHAATAS